MIPAVVDCTAAEPDPLPAVQYRVLFARTGKKLIAARGTIDKAGQETLHASIEPTGFVKMFGMGRFVDGSSSWSLTFASARPDAAGGAVFTGRFRDRFGNTRGCKLTIESGLD